MARDTTRGYRRWIRAMNNNARRPHTEAAQLFRKRVARATAFNELRGLTGETPWVHTWPTTRSVPLDTPAYDERGFLRHYRTEKIEVREYYCSDYCLALALQIGYDRSAEDLWRIAHGTDVHTGPEWARRRDRYARVYPGTAHRASRCRTCNAKVKDGRVIELGYDITEISEPIPMPPSGKVTQPPAPPTPHASDDTVRQLQATIGELRREIIRINTERTQLIERVEHVTAERDSAYDDLRRAGEREGTLVSDNIRLTRELELEKDRRTSEANRAAQEVAAAKADLVEMDKMLATATTPADSAGITINIAKVVIKNP